MNELEELNGLILEFTDLENIDYLQFQVTVENNSDISVFADVDVQSQFYQLLDNEIAQEICEKIAHEINGFLFVNIESRDPWYEETVIDTNTRIWFNYKIIDDE